MLATAAFLAVFPSLVIIVVLALRSRSIDRTTPALFVAAAIGGAVAVVPVAVLLLVIARVPVSYDDTVARFLAAYVRSALLEETFKLIAVVTVLRVLAPGRPRISPPAVAIAVAAAFAAAENLLHLSAPIDAVALRAITSLPVHILASAIVGLALTRSGGGLRVAIGLVAAVALHGTYNLSVTADWAGISFAIAAIACLGTIGSVLFLSPATADHASDGRYPHRHGGLPDRQNYTRSRRKP